MISFIYVIAIPVMDNGNRLQFDGLQALEPDILKIVGISFLGRS